MIRTGIWITNLVKEEGKEVSELNPHVDEADDADSKAWIKG
jgi:hypothetical protein